MRVWARRIRVAVAVRAAVATCSWATLLAGGAALPASVPFRWLHGHEVTLLRVTSPRDEAIAVIEAFIAKQVGGDIDPMAFRGQAEELADELIGKKVIPAIVLEGSSSPAGVHPQISHDASAPRRVDEAPDLHHG